MEVKLMRKLDRWLGDAACSMFAAAHKVSKPFIRKREIKNIVVMKFFGMGSLVVASPTVAALRDQYPNAKIHFVTFASNRAVIELLGQTDFAYYIDPSTPQSFVSSTLKVANDLRKAKCDLMVDLEFFAKFPLVLASMAMIPRKAGFYLVSEPWRAELLDVTGSYNCYYHTKDIWLSLAYLEATGDFYYLNFAEFAAKYRYPKIEPSQIERAAVRAKLAQQGIKSESLIVLNPNGSVDLAPEARKWPMERYAELADRLAARHPNAQVLLIGAKSERNYVQSIADLAKSPRIHCIAGDLTIRELVTLFAESSLVISNDSGPMHLACLVDAPTVGLFFADTPVLFAPLGSNVRSVAAQLYSIPLFSVYNGKDVAVGKPTEQVGNAASTTVTVDAVLIEAEAVFAARRSALEVAQ